MIVFKKKIFSKFNYNKYYISLRCSKNAQHKFYYIVVTNSRGGILRTLGFFNPKKSAYQNFLAYYDDPLKYYAVSSYKLIGIDFPLLIYWLGKGAIPTNTMFLVFKYLGVFKTKKFFHMNFNFKLKKKSSQKIFLDTNKIENKLENQDFLPSYLDDFRYFKDKEK